jgi:chemotaxis regulatin CheY-phosphate phosphatase CheZ
LPEQRSLTRLEENEYEAIEAAVMETARGRWFLGEYARRNRTADTLSLLDAIGRLEQAVAGERAAQGIDHLRFDLAEMAKAIARTKDEVSALRPHEEPSRFAVASEALDGIVRQTEQATSDILESAENIQEAAWTLREGGADAGLCGELDRRATDIYTACSFQDLTAQRIARIIQVLRYLEGRINAMMDIWGGDEEPSDRPAPAAPQTAPDLTQTDVDFVIVSEDPFAEPVDEFAAAAEAALASEAPSAEWASDPGAGDATSAPHHRRVTAEGSGQDDLAVEDWGGGELAEGVDDASAEEVAAMSARLAAELEAAPPIALPPATRPEPALPELSAAAFAELDALEAREKLRRFT